jgi:acyl-CoA synthetase (AMP-forming)/AMP-acid ligase II
VNEPATILESLARRAQSAPDAPAFTVGGEEISYSALHADALRLAGALQACGLQRGARCALALGTSGDFLRALFAVQMLGAIPVAMNTSLPAEGFARRLTLIRAAMMLTDKPLALGQAATGPRIESVANLLSVPARELQAVAPPAPGDIAYLQITSGTTGEPRAAAISHRSLNASLWSSQRLLQAGPADVLVGWVPLHHDLGLVRFVFGTIYFGASAHLLPPSLASLGAWLQTMTRVRATITGAPDFGYRVAARTVAPEGIDLSALRFATNGGEPARLSTIAAFEERFGCPGAVRPGYGLAEATLGVTALRRGEALAADAAGRASTGRPFDGIEVRVVGDAGAPARHGDAGDIEVRGAVVFDGYFGDEEATREALRADGWLRTGDTGALDAAGNLYVHGRTRSMIKRAGAQVSPFEAEQAADRVPGVRLSAAVGIARDDIGGTEDVVIVVEVRPEELASDAARQAVTAQVVRTVTEAIGFPPGEVLIVAPRTIPLTANGKIRHGVLKDLLTGGTIPRQRPGTASGRSLAG